MTESGSVASRARVLNLRPLHLIIGIIAGAVVLRIFGLSWGLPTSLHADEWAIVESAVSLTSRGSFEPTIFLRPDHLEIKLSVLLYTVYSFLPGVGLLDAEFAADPTPFYVMSRSVTVVFAAASIALAAAVGARFSRTTAVVAALLFALYPPFVEHSRYATPDMPLTALTLLVVLACMHYMAQPGWLPLLVASAALGASITVKYPGALGGAVIAASVIAVAIPKRELTRIVTHGAVAVGVALATVFVISPVLLVNVRGVIAAVRAESRTEHTGADGLGFGGNLLFYLGDFAGWAGLIVCVAAVIGASLLISQRSIQSIPLIIGSVYWVALSSLALHWDRWGLPMAVTPLLLAAVAFASGIDKQFQSRPWTRPVAMIALAISLLHMTAVSVAITASTVVPDTRVSSDLVLREAGVNERNTAFEGYSPFSPDTPSRVFSQVQDIDGDPFSVNPQITFLMTSSCDNQRFMDDERYLDEQAFYDWIDDRLPLVLELDAPEPLVPSPLEAVATAQSVHHVIELASSGRTGCTVLVYSLPPAP